MSVRWEVWSGLQPMVSGPSKVCDSSYDLTLKNGALEVDSVIMDNIDYLDTRHNSVNITIFLYLGMAFSIWLLCFIR